MSVLDLHLSLFQVPMPLFSFILTWDYCLFLCKCSSKSFPRYLTHWLDIRCFPWCSHLKKESSFRLFRQNILSSAFCTFMYNSRPSAGSFLLRRKYFSKQGTFEATSFTKKSRLQYQGATLYNIKVKYHVHLT